MILLPVVERELRVAARRRSAFWSRLVAAAVAVLCGAGALCWDNLFFAWGAAGASLLAALTRVAFGFCLLAGPVLAADVLSEERREGTLGFLFLTSLHGHDVVLGKLAAVSVTAFFGLLAALPVLAISILMGGVQAAEFLRTGLVLGNTLFLSLATGVLVSSCCLQARSALAMTGFLLFLLAGAGPWVEDQGRAGGAPGWLTLACLVVSPSYTLSQAAAVQNAMGRHWFWVSLACTHALAWTMLGAASWLTARGWREPTGWFAQPSWRRRWNEWHYGGPAKRWRTRQRLLNQNPVTWLGRRHQLKRRLLWAAVAVALISWLLFRARHPQPATDPNYVFLIGLWLLVPLKWLAASEASQRLVADQQSGALELLLTTPLTVREMLQGQLRSLRYLFAWPAAVVLAMQLGMFALSPRAAQGDINWYALALLNAVVCLWDFPVLSWVAMWLALRARHANRALLGAVGCVLILPWLWAIALAAVPGLAWRDRFLSGLEDYALPALWFGTCAANNLVFHLLARHRLTRGLRELALGRYARTSAN
jgi:hypothetical protein